MTIDLFVEPRKVYTWSEFKKIKPKYSIALDGFVSSSTKRYPKGPYVNFDHHLGVDSFSTRSTSEQVHMEINMKLFDTFKKNGEPHANVYVNHPDEDSCLAWWLLKNHEKVKASGDTRINKLVYCEDKLDCTAGTYPFGDTSLRRKMAWIFQPYYDERFEGRLPLMSDVDMKSLIGKVETRITDYINGQGEELPLDGNYVKIGGNCIWSLTKEIGPASRLAMLNDGIFAFVTLVSQRPGGTYDYTIGRQSVWIDFPVKKIYNVLNKIEGDNVNKNNKWNGSDTIGGSPRDSGSMIPPKRLEEIINLILQKKL